MSRTSKLAALLAASIALAGPFGTSAFAESRHQDGTWRDNRDSRGGNRGYEMRTYRDNERVTVEGRVQSFRQERDGYRVQLDRGAYSYWVPLSRLRGRGRDLRAGISIRFGGVFRGGWVYVDSIGWPDDGYYNDGYRDGYVRGVVERVDLYRGTLLLRDDYSGRFITVDMRRMDGRWNRSIDLNDLRRGDYVTLSGDWYRGIFLASRIDDLRPLPR